MNTNATYQRLGSSNLRVSRLCLGTMMFGEQTPDDEAAAIVASAREHGVNFIDTADVYNEGRSEEVVGQLLAGQRHDWVLASKIGNATGKGANLAHYSRKWMMQGVEQSLTRLATDYLDILYLHRDYPGENLAEAIRAVDDLIRAGKLRYFGLSNFNGWRISEVIRLCDQLNAPRPVVCQPYYNLLNRQPEVEILPACQHYGLGVVPYSPIARGVLTGKYAPGQPPATYTRAGRAPNRWKSPANWPPTARRAASALNTSPPPGYSPTQPSPQSSPGHERWRRWKAITQRWMSPSAQKTKPWSTPGSPPAMPRHPATPIPTTRCWGAR